MLIHVRALNGDFMMIFYHLCLFVYPDMRLHVHHGVGTKFKSEQNNLTQKLSIVKTTFSNPVVSLCDEDIQAVTQACGTVLADRPYRPGMMTDPPPSHLWQLDRSGQQSDTDRRPANEPNRDSTAGTVKSDGLPTTQHKARAP